MCSKGFNSLAKLFFYFTRLRYVFTGVHFVLVFQSKRPFTRKTSHCEAQSPECVLWQLSSRLRQFLHLICRPLLPRKSSAARQLHIWHNVFQQWRFLYEYVSAAWSSTRGNRPAPWPVLVKGLLKMPNPEKQKKINTASSSSVLNLLWLSWVS